jgi:electron transport complex protein RnfA
MIDTSIFVIFVGFSLNLVLQFGVGVRDIIVTKKNQRKYSLYQCMVLFFSVIFTWLMFTFVLIPLGFAFLETLLLLPFSIFIPLLLEKSILRLFSESAQSAKSSVLSAYNGLIFASNFFVLKTAESFLEALTMTVGFCIGYILSMLIVQEIHKMSLIETVPKALRGIPLMLISLGLVSLGFSAAAFFLQMGSLF